MKRQWVVMTIAAALLATAVGPAAGSAARQTEDPGVMLRAAIEKEEVEGDLQGALEIYKAIVTRHSGRADVAARAQLRVGRCYEKLGNREAVKAYEAVLSRFPKETEAVSEARSRLAELRKAAPTGLSLTRLLSPEAVQLEAPRLSPDGTKLVGVEISTGQNLAVHDLATGKLEYLTKYGWEKGDHFVWAPVWSPKSNEIVHQDMPMGEGEDYELRITDLAGKSRVLMTNRGGGLVPCDWLDDGSAVVAVRADKEKKAALGLIAVKDGSFREISPMKRPFETRGDMPSYYLSAAADASPDGRSVVFCDVAANGKQDIYIVSADGRTRSTLIDHPADDTEPRWSPDGGHVVFLSDRSGEKALWGVAVRDGKSEGAPFLVLEGLQNSDLGSWTKEGLQTWASVLMTEICVIDIDPRSGKAADKPRIMEFPRASLKVAPRWSPDGRYLSSLGYLAQGSGMPEGPTLMIMPLGGGKVREYRIDGGNAPLNGTGHWMPDGSQGYVVWDQKKLSFGRLDMASGEWKSRQVPAGDGFTGFLAMTWSADGKGIFYTPMVPEGATPKIVLMDLESGERRTIFTGPVGDSYGRMIRASRDHKRLAVSSQGAIVIVDVESGKSERIADVGMKLWAPAWSPDGLSLVAKGQPDGGGNAAELYVVTLADGKVESLDVARQLPRNSQIVTAPDWSPDGRKIAFDVRSYKAETNLIRNVITQK
jgi:Tol biopolymer transport system component